MFSASNSNKDFARCYDESANACVRKPHDLEGTLQVVREIERFWFHTAMLAL